MARGRSTPYKAQVDRMLGGEDCPQIFSAASLEERFSHPRAQKRGSNIGGIHKALMKAFSEGKIITFVDDGGTVLREADIVVPGSKAIGQPQIFGRPGAASPSAGFHPVTYEETVRRGIDHNGYGGSAADTAEAEATEAVGDASGDGGEPQDEPAASLMTSEQAGRVLSSYPSPSTSAPDFLDDRLLRVWVSMPEVCTRLSQGLDTAGRPDKFDLIRAGITRKQRVWRSDSTIAGNLVTLCRRSPVLWANVVRSVMKQYMTGDAGAKLLGELGELAADPLEFYEQSEHPPDAIVLVALALGVDEAVLELLAADCASDLDEQKVVDKTAAQEQRIQMLEAETGELRRQAKDREKELRAATKQQRDLEAENARMREAAERDGDAGKAKVAADEKLRERAEAAEAQVEKLETERIPELEAQLEALEDASDRLEAVEDDLRSERLLRTQAEQDAARLNARVRALTDDLSRASDSRNLPTDNATALLDVLLRPIGQAARHAAERLANGRPKPHDELLLELAASVAQMSRRLDTDADSDADRDSIEPADAMATPADVEQAVVADAEPADSDADAEVVELPATPGAEPEPEPAGPEPAAASEPRRPLRARRAKLKVRPLGGAGEVGGSAILVTNNSGHTVLLDCGQRVRGEYGLDTEPPFHRSIGQDGRLHAVLLSHAHIDHVGSLPVLHRLQSETQHEPIPVYMTEPTRRLAQIMLEDSAKIQQFRELDKAEVGFLDYGVGTMEAAYRLADVNRVLDDEFVRDVTPGLAVPIPGTSFVARFIPVAHVLGSCAIHLTDTENDQTLLYTGDLGPFGAPQATLPQYSLADMLAAHLVIMESTYGSRRPEFTDGRRARRSLSPREAAVKVLCQRAEHAHDNGGVVLLPAFSLGRTQELAMLIEHAKRDGQAPPGDIVVAGMGEKITQVYENYSRGTNAWARAEDMPRVDELGGRLRNSPDLRFDDVVGEVLDGGFSYVIASPAMLGSGWSRSFLTQMVDNPAHAVVMSGYVPRHGGKIPRLHQLHKGDTLDLGDNRHRIQCEFDQLKGLSAHAPAVDLQKFAQYMARQGDNVAFAMVHGDEASQLALAEDVADLPGVASADPLHNGQIWQPTRP